MCDACVQKRKTADYFMSFGEPEHSSNPFGILLSTAG
jgi:hypothetical protein